MTQHEQKVLAELLQKVIIKTNELFKTKEKSDAYIIGYLQGTIKTVIDELGAPY